LERSRDSKIGLFNRPCHNELEGATKYLKNMLLVCQCVPGQSTAWRSVASVMLLSILGTILVIPMQNMGDVSGFSIDVLHFSPSLHNVNGEKIDSLQVDQQSLIRVSMQNNDQKERPFVIVTEVRDSSGITVFLSGRVAGLMPMETI